MTELPEMTVEKREGKSHGLPKPDTSDKNLFHELGQAIKLNGDAKEPFWKESTLQCIKAYSPVDISYDEIKDYTQKIFGFRHWSEVTEYVQNDMCSEFFNVCLKYCLSQKETHVKNLDFIDGSGIGYLGAYRDRLKETLEKAFDEKYYHKVARPLVFAMSKGMDIVDNANYIHPGHYSYPAGHGTKFFTVVEVLRSVFDLSEDCDRALYVVAVVFSMGRTGSLIHYPMDNLVGGYLTTLKEFKGELDQR